MRRVHSDRHAARGREVVWGTVVLTRVVAGLVAVLAMTAGAARSLAQDPDQDPDQDADQDVLLTRLRVLADEPAEDMPAPAACGIVRGGVPLPRALGVTQVDELAVARERVLATGELVREDVPQQMRVLSRWGGARDDLTLPIRWVLVDVEAPSDARLVLLRQDRPMREAVPVALEATESIVVDDRRLEFRVPRSRFAPLSNTRLRASEFDPSTATALQDAGLDVVVVLRDGQGESKRYSFSDDARVAAVAVEESGPLRATVLTVGELATDASGCVLRAELRVRASRGAASVDIELAVENATSKSLEIVSLELVAPTRLRGVITCAGRGGAFVGHNARLEQRHTLESLARESQNFSYTLSLDGIVRERGQRSDGALLLTDDRQTLGVSVDRFWEHYPGAISMQDAVLSVGVLPRGDVAHRLVAGARVLSFVTLTLDGEPAGRPVRRLVPDPHWVARTGAIGSLAALGADVGDDVQNAAVRHLERLQLGLLDVRACDPQGPIGAVAPASIVTQRETRGGANPALRYSVDLYGWEQFGDLVDAEGRVHGDHGWVAGLCRAYLARQDVRFLDAAVELARQRQIAGRAHGGHRAVEGLLLLHALTGDESLRRAAQEITMPDGVATATAPEIAQAVSGLLAVYAHDGADDVLTAAASLHDRLLAVGESDVLSRHALDDVLPILRAHEDYHRATADARALAGLLRSLRHVTSAYAGSGRHVNDAYLPMQPHDTELGVSLPFPIGIAVADSLAYAHRATGVGEYRDLARRIFCDAVLFLQAPPMEIVGPGYHARVSAAPLRYPGREIAYGELVLGGAPWLVAGDAQRVLRGDQVPATDDVVLVLTAAATQRATSLEPAADELDGRTGDVGEAPDVVDDATAARGPNAADPLAGTPNDSAGAQELETGEVGAAPDPPSFLIVDDGEAVVHGRWSVERSTRALSGSQIVAGPQATRARAEFRIVVPFDGRVRVYGQWQSVRGRAASASVRLESRAGAVRVAIDTARAAGRWRLLGELEVGRGNVLRVDFERNSEFGTLAIDGVRIEPVR